MELTVSSNRSHKNDVTCYLRALLEERGVYTLYALAVVNSVHLVDMVVVAAPLAACWEH